MNKPEQRPSQDDLLAIRLFIGNIDKREGWIISDVSKMLVSAPIDWSGLSFLYAEQQF